MVPAVKEITLPSGGSVIPYLSIVKSAPANTLHTSPGVRGVIVPFSPGNSVYLIVSIGEEPVKSKTFPLPFDVKPIKTSPAVNPIVGVPVWALICKVLTPDIVSPGT